MMKTDYLNGPPSYNCLQFCNKLFVNLKGYYYLFEPVLF